MKKLYATLILALAAVSVSAQNPSTYFMEGTGLRSQWNPAFAPERGYVNIPLIGNLYVGLDGNLSLGTIVKKNANGDLTTILSSTISPNKALKGIGSMAFTNFDTSWGLVGFGKYAKDGKTFWSADLSLHIAADARIPRGIFEMVKNGPSASGVMDCSNLGLSFDTYAEAGFTYSMPLPVLDEKIYVGARFKFLVGLVHMGLNFDNFTATLNDSAWSADLAGRVEVAGFAPEGTRPGETFNMDDVMDEDAIKVPAGYGFGFDLGATYQVLPELQVSLSVNDLGGMFYGKNRTTVGKTAAHASYNGMIVNADGSSEADFDFSEFDEMEFTLDNAKGINKRLHTSINMGGEYNFLDRRIGVGLFYSTRFYDHATRHNLVLSANFRPLSWLHVTGSWSLIDNAGLGLALNICPSFINFFVGTDVLLSRKTPEWIPINQGIANVNFGLSVPIGRKGMRHAPKVLAAAE